MKTILLLLVLAPFISYAQTIDENLTDSYTGAKIKSTHYQIIVTELSGYVYQKARRVDDNYYLFIKNYGSGIVTNKDALMIKLANDSIIKIFTSQPVTTGCIGCGAKGLQGSAAWGIEVHYVITKEQIESLKRSQIIGIRMYYSDSYKEYKITKNKSIAIISSLNFL